MTILSRYLLRSFLPMFLVCVGVFIFVMLMTYFLRLFNLALMKGIPLSWILMCFIRLAPYFLGLAFPMAFVVALLLTLGRLSESGELMALRASGYSFLDVLKPFFAGAVLLSGVLFLANHWLSPKGFHSFQNSYQRALGEITRLDLEPNALTSVGQWEVFAKKAHKKTGVLEGVRAIKRQGQHRSMHLTAPTGKAEIETGVGVRLSLENGSMVWPGSVPEDHTVSNFKKAEFFLPFTGEAARKPELRELSTSELRAELAAGTLDDQKKREHLTEAALRSANALAPFVLFWVASPLGIRLEKRSGPVGFALSLGILFGFYALMAVGVGLGRKNAAFSSSAPWLANVACLALGAGLWSRTLRR